MVQFFKSSVYPIVSSDVNITPTVKEMKFVSIARSFIHVKEGKEKKSLHEVQILPSLFLISLPSHIDRFKHI
jgi:hypothetical protein